MIAATINAIGFPLNEFGTFATSRRSRIVEKITNTNINPAGTAIEFTNISVNVNLEVILSNATNNTAQLVVISGK